jgi:hypothetical protein
VVVAGGYQGDAAVVARAAVVSIRCPAGTLLRSRIECREARQVLLHGDGHPQED